MKLHFGNCQLIREVLNQTPMEKNNNIKNLGLPYGEFLLISKKKKPFKISHSCESLMMVTKRC